jgi:hypothetical protein
MWISAPQFWQLADVFSLFSIYITEHHSDRDYKTMNVALSVNVQAKNGENVKWQKGPYKKFEIKERA